MATLRFDSEDCATQSEIIPTSGDSRIEVKIFLAVERWTEVEERLGELQNREGSELRTEFPQGWTIFWKIREGESRFFVAHPEPDQWVATLALSPSHLEKVRERMRSGTPGRLSALESVSRMSNVEVEIAMRTESGS